MSFDSIVGVLALAVASAAVFIALIGRRRRDWVAAILWGCGVALILFTIYFAFIYVKYETEVRRIQAAILQAVDSRPLTFEQIRDTVALADAAATSQEILEAIDRLQNDNRLHATHADWQDVNGRPFYTKIYAR